MKLEHTPGPWFVLKGVFEWNICHKPKVLQGTPAGYPVARCPTSIKNAKANARLIAAAPEMIEALIEYRKGTALPKADIDKLIEKATGNRCTS